MFSKIPMLCLDKDCYRSEVSTLCTREEFWYGHVTKKSTEKVIEILTKYNLVVHEDELGRYTLLNIFTDFCKERIALKIFRDYELKEGVCCP